jgi:hypothetical protein
MCPHVRQRQPGAGQHRAERRNAAAGRHGIQDLPRHDDLLYGGLDVDDR